jgi:histidinol-phosphate aminotransferase
MVAGARAVLPPPTPGAGGPSGVPSAVPTPRILPLIAALPATVPFVGPETQERRRGRPFRARIGANENVFGPSPEAVAAMAAAAAEAWKYGDPENYALKQALAAHLGVGPENLVIGEGIDGLLGLAVRLVVAPGTPVVTSRGAYPTFNFHVAASGGRLVTVPYRDDREDGAALVARAAAEAAAIVYLANPDNPMGTWWDAATVAGLAATVPDGTLLCLDEAYGEFAPAGTLAPIDVSLGNVLRFRTFSKAYGLAGARIAYAVGAAPLIAEFEKVRNHFGVNKVAQAGALAALADTDHLARVVAGVTAARDRIAAIAAANGLRALPSATNFVAVDLGRDGDYARAVLGRMIDRDLFVRMPGVAPLDRCIRVGCGLPADLDYLAEVLPTVL